MKSKLSRLRYLFGCYIFIILQWHAIYANAQAFSIDNFFSDYTAITFYTPDSNNFIYNEIQNYDDLKRTIRQDCLSQ